MFLKPFHIKSNTQLKGSERKKLRARLLSVFPVLNENTLSGLISNKADVTVVRIVTHCATPVTCFNCDRQPLFIELNGQLLPTLYSMWLEPDLVPSFATHEPVVARLRSGADLMLPGVIIDTKVPPQYAYGRKAKGDIVAVITDVNRAAVAVGLTARSSEDMYLAGGRGKCVIVNHVIGDFLWKEGTRCERPTLGSPHFLLSSNARSAEEMSLSAADCPSNSSGETVCHSAEKTDELDNLIDRLDTSLPTDLQPVPHSTDADTNDANVSLSSPASTENVEEDANMGANMDQLLHDAFLQALKTSAKKVQLPILVSSFYAQHMQPCSVQPLDVKKSSYKKLSKFLDKMQEDCIVEVKELSKGVQSIAAINYDHPQVAGFKTRKIDKESQSKPLPAENLRFHSSKFDKIEDVYFVNANVAPLFKTFGVEKSAHLPATKVRDHLTSYVKNKQLQNATNKTMVKLDLLLVRALTGHDGGVDAQELSWNELHQQCLQRMSPGYVLSFVGETPQVRRGKPPSVELSTATRSGNKKVTLVLNLPVYGIDPAEFAHKCQLGVAASTSVGPAANRAAGTVQVVVQGNQIRFIGNLLQQHYGLPKRCILGLEKAAKK